jgi:hypothetical protein
MPHGRSVLALAITAIALASVVRADDRADPASARESLARRTLARFLAAGAFAPYASSGRDGALDGVTSVRPVVTGELAFARPGEFVASVRSSSEVTFFSRSRPLLWVDARRADRASEIRRRAVFSLDDDAQRAGRFLEDHYPDFRERRFELVSKERVDHDSLVEDELVFVERPRAGVAACWPNRIDVSLDPEDGSVSTFLANDDRIESSSPPALDAKAARRALLVALGDRVRRENRDFLAAKARIELIAARDRSGEPRTAWLVAGIFVVDAASGELLARRAK